MYSALAKQFYSVGTQHAMLDVPVNRNVSDVYVELDLSGDIAYVLAEYRMEK